MSVDKLLDALECLYEETKSYIEVNNLGDPHHNQSMKLARSAIESTKSEAVVETRWRVVNRYMAIDWCDTFDSEAQAMIVFNKPYNENCSKVERLDTTVTLVATKDRTGKQ